MTTGRLFGSTNWVAALAVGLFASSADAGLISYDLELANPATSIFRLQNTSPDSSAEITGMHVTIGDTAYNFDLLTGFSALIDTGAPIVSTLVTPDLVQDGIRADEFELSFTGFGQGDRFQFQADLDLDNINTPEDFRSIYFNNGPAPNAVVSVSFVSGAESGILSLTLPDDPLINDPQVFNYSVSGQTQAVPVSTSLALIGLGLASISYKRVRSKKNV